MITLQHLLAVQDMPKLRAAQYVAPLNAAMEEFNITSPLQQTAFLAQIFHESGNLSKLEEDLYYRTPERLMKIWPKRFPTLESATPYVCNPQKLASKVYADRMGNGSEASGEGYTHRGAGLIQLTGKDNQYACALALDIDLLKIGDYLRTADGACRSAAWFWSRSGAGIKADKGDFDGVSDLINLGRKTEKVGDAIGYAHRVELYKAFKKALGA